MTDTPTLRRRSFVPTFGDVLPIEACEGASVYVSHPKPKPHPAVWHGIAVHRFLELSDRLGKAGALLKIKKYRGAHNVCSKLDLHELPKGEREVEMIYDPEAGAAERATYRDAEPDRHYFTKPDIIWRTPAGGLAFSDYKTGDRARLPQNEPQFWLIAVALWLLGGRPLEGIHAETINITLGPPRRTIHHFEVRELEQLERRFVDTHRRMRMARAWARTGDRPKLTIGDHCSTCRARFACPKGKKIVALEEALRR